MIKILHLMVGVPGSGKSTFAEKLAAETGLTLIQSDKVRERVTGSESDVSQDRKVWPIIERELDFALSKGSVIFDATNYRARNRKMAIEYARKHDAFVKAYVFHVDKNECHRRNKARSRVVPDFVIENMHRDFEAPNLEEVDEIVNIVTGDIQKI